MGRLCPLVDVPAPLEPLLGPAQTRKEPEVPEVHWLSSPYPYLIHETIALVLAKEGSFELSRSYENSLPPSLGIWIGADGDDSGSNFEVTIEKLQIEFFEDVK